MPRFSKPFPFLQRFHFPPFGEPINPASVSREVQLVHELFRADMKHAIRLETVSNSTAGAGVGVNHTIVTEPPSGYIAVPIIMSIAHFGVAGVENARFGTVVSGNAADLPTGIWPALDWLDVGLTEGIVGVGHWTPVACRLPIPRGNTMQITWGAGGGVDVGRTVLSRAFIAHVPIECIDWTDFMVGSFTRTEAV